MALEQIDKKTEAVSVKPAPTSVLSSLRRGLTVSRNYDLGLLIMLALALPGIVVLPIPLLRAPLGLLTVLLAPGYALIEAIFPQRDDLDGPARFGLSFGLSIALLPILALLLEVTWGLRFWPIVLTLSCVILVFCLVAGWRRGLLVPINASALRLANPGVLWRWSSSLGRRFFVVAAVLVFVISAYGVFVVVSPNRGEQLTEFYVLNAQGLAQAYPNQAVLNQPTKLLPGIINREGKTNQYRVELKAGDQVLAQSGPLTLKDGEKWEQPLIFTLTQAGDDQEIELFLYYNNNPDPYRQLHLAVNVANK